MKEPDQRNQEIIDIEQYAKEGKKIPHAEQYRIRIDKQHYVVSSPEMTGEQLLTLAQKQAPGRFSLYQKLKGGETKKIEGSQIADLRSPGVERFMTLPLDQTEGAEPALACTELRREFELPEEDVCFLEHLGLPWETVIERNVQRVVIYGFELPEGYKQPRADLNVRIERTYPDTQIDMAYFFPPVQRADGGAIRAICNDKFDGKDWQRWSRHRTTQNPWRAGLDSLESHLILVGEWLRKGVKGV